MTESWSITDKITLTGVVISLLVGVVAAVIAHKSRKAADRSAKATEESATAAAASATAGQRSAIAAEKSVEAANRTAIAAEEQTNIQNQLRIDAAQPFVWVDIRPDAAVGTLLNLVVGNSGHTIATDVRVTWDVELPRVDQVADQVVDAEETLSRGLPSLPPGRIYSWPLGQGFALLRPDMPKAFLFTIEATGPFGPLPTATYTIDISSLRSVLNRPEGSLHELKRAVHDLTAAVKDIRGELRNRYSKELRDDNDT